MTKEAIITLPDKRLRQKSEKVHVITDDILQLIDDLKAVALDWEDSRPHEASAAISAVQIGVMKKVIIVRDDFDDKKNRNFTALINPEIVKAEGEVVEDYEGCLSVPDVYGKVPRNSKIRVKAIDVDGNEVRFKSEGFLARILQHEIDHTNGIPFIDRIGEVEDAYFKLDDKGELQSLSYEKDIKKNSILWD
jgi:peptide deformylase